MRVKLWKQVSLSLLLPVMIASAVIIYAVYYLGTISNRINFIEIADDINLTLLELRRYEKNILLFKEERNIKNMHMYLEQLDSKVRKAENEIVEVINKLNYKPLQENIRIYRESAESLVSSTRKEQKLLEDIRPLGRLIEKNALRKEVALELRRHEKNYIIYNERQAINKLNYTAKELVSTNPELGIFVSRYLKAFDSLVENESLKESLVEKMRYSGRAIEKITMRFADKKRAAIKDTIFTARNLLVMSFLFLIISTVVVASYFSASVVKILNTIGKSFARLKAGDFAQGMDLNTDRAPEEINSFVKAYYQTIEDLGASRTELENTTRKLEEANRELLEKQDALVEAGKFTAMRLLASEIAHEINNPLSSLTTFLGMCYEEIAADDPRKETFALMLKEVNRCRSILRELAEFAKKEPLKLREVNPSALIRDAIQVVRRQHEKSAVSLTAFCSELPEKVLLDPVLIHQALVNILNNAYQFTSPGGCIEIEGYVDCKTMVIEIKDSGKGISQENLPYIFEPFFSTRKECGGCGLGLAITKKIIERHYGSIYVDSKADKETVFTIKLAAGNREI